MKIHEFNQIIYEQQIVYDDKDKKLTTTQIKEIIRVANELSYGILYKMIKSNAINDEKALSYQLKALGLNISND
jgi:hypothetical protein